MRDIPFHMPLFREVTEVRETPDYSFEDPDGGWGTRVTKPEGGGWRIIDFSHDKRTRWVRRGR